MTTAPPPPCPLPFARSGTLERDEVRALAQKLHLGVLSEQALDDAMRLMDEDGSGAVDFQEFYRWVRQRDSEDSEAASGLPSRVRAEACC